jgi:hypothetical protein
MIITPPPRGKTVVATAYFMDIAYVAMTIYLYCKHIFHVASIYFRCFQRIFQVLHLDIGEVYLDVA